MMSAHDKQFHVKCFRCLKCGVPIQAGETYALKGTELYCKRDYDDMLAVDAGPVSRSTTPGRWAPAWDRLYYYIYKYRYILDIMFIISVEGHVQYIYIYILTCILYTCTNLYTIYTY